MKLIKNAWKLLLATTLASSFFLSGCVLDLDGTGGSSSGGGTSSSTGGGNSSSSDTTPVTGDYLLKDGASNYKIVLPDDADADEALAGERLQSLFKEATGYTLPIVTDNTISAIDEDDAYILIGDNDFALASNLVPAQADVKTTGYTIKTKDKSIYIAGAKSVGTLFGVYNFLGRILNYDYFAEDIYSLDKGVEELALRDYDMTVVPDCEFNTVTHTFLTAAKLKNYSMYAELTTPIRGKTGHGSLN